MKKGFTAVIAGLMLGVFAAAGSAQSSVGVKMSTLGVGFEAADQVGNRFDIRGGFNTFSYTRAFTNSGISYSGNLRLRSLTVNGDIYLWGPMHFSPGLLIWNGNRGTADGMVPGAQSFTLGDVSYISNTADPITGKAKLSLNSVAPELLLGFGHLVPRGRRRFGVNFEFGAVYQGAPVVSLNLSGSACTSTSTGLTCVNAASDPNVQSNIAAQEKKLNHNLSALEWYPVASLGISYRF